jgi:hypothetical protein
MPPLASRATDLSRIVDEYAAEALAELQLDAAWRADSRCTRALGDRSGLLGAGWGVAGVW